MKNDNSIATFTVTFDKIQVREIDVETTTTNTRLIEELARQKFARIYSKRVDYITLKNKRHYSDEEFKEALGLEVLPWYAPLLKV